ncbi:endonuclease/exonuclease/phosphatase family protein [Marinifilum flexuosum]|uniref:endonuclease/exonuclease/phosphatase family protein n=1 Tax=Marinifilum flexuosum TaxID=1117708 RepID=UPI002494F575|nr:endonuclease/exonuclease/phosphatase family protein [Marinifilum flexuosum]
MFRKLLLLISVAFVIASCNQQTKDYTVAFYNVENLFDTINHPEKWDDDFTPEGKLKFNGERYQDKLEKLAQVLSSMDTLRLPSIIGLCEIENKKVIEDLCKQETLIEGNYGIAHSESPDKRGIDCALIYKKEDFKYLKHEAIYIQFPWEPNYKTRDILYVEGIIGTDTVHIFVNHWPSRRGGLEKSEKNRVFVAEQLKSAVDGIQTKNPTAKIIIMGDFNDEPTNKSVSQTLNAGNNQNSSNPSYLYNLVYNMDAKGEGTYNYRGNWNMLDNLIVSNSLLNDKNGLHTSFDAGKIFKEEWICYKNKKGILVPSRTYGGLNYYGGYSDHFPVYFKISD